MYHGQPSAIGVLTDQQQLRRVARFPFPVEPCRYHPRRIDDEDVARRNQLGEIAEMEMANLAAGAIEDEQAARRAIGEGMLGNLIAWKVVVEIRQPVCHEGSSMRRVACGANSDRSMPHVARRTDRKST